MKIPIDRRSRHETAVLAAESDPAAVRPFASSAIGLLSFVVVCMAVSLIGGIAVVSTVNGWYADLAKPAFTPPNWVFTPVWTLLYTLMAVAGWRVWNLGHGLGAWPLKLYGAQLGLNAAWAPIFFALRQPGWALAEAIVLLVFLAWTILAFRRVDRAAGALLIPYLLWLIYSTVLNATIWAMN